MSDVLKLKTKPNLLKLNLDAEYVQEVTAFEEKNEAKSPEKESEKLKEKAEEIQKLLEEKHKIELQVSFDNGFAEGQQALKERLEKYYTDKLLERFEQLHEMFSDFDKKIESYDNSFEKLVLDTACLVAEKIVKGKIEHKTIIREVLHESLKKVLGANEITVRLSPSDYEELFEKEDDIALDDSFAKIKFGKDERIEPGGCFVETEIGNVDARISSQFAELKKVFEINMATSDE
jgi:flagellar assembly protein FliH